MKKLISVVLSVILITSLFAGCGQQAPVVSEPAETQASAPAAQPEAFQLPIDFTGEWTGVDGFLHVTADAVVETPYGLKIPIAAVEKKQITQADADKLMDEFIGDAQLYASWTGKWAEMPENYEKKASRTLQDRDFFGPGLTNVYAETDQGVIQVDISNPELSGSSAIFYTEGFAGPMRPNVIPAVETPAITENQALKISQELLTRLGLNHYVCTYTQAVSFIDHDPYSYYENGGQVPFGDPIDSGYDLTFFPTVAGIPSPILNYACGTAQMEGDPYHTWSYEAIRIAVNSKGQVVFFYWESPHTLPQVTETEAKLLPFRDIAEVFPEMIMTTHSWRGETNAESGHAIYDEMKVDKVELNLMRVRDRYDYEKASYIPVWDFWATTSSHTEEEAYLYLNNMEPRHEIVLTVNALDGTIIDRQLGY